jgi:hypothetical protein
VQKSLVFISHITEEKEIALALKQLVETTFLGMIEVFVSSDPTSIKLGRKWLDEITHALKTCAVEIILASPESVKRPWINFEAGAGWIREIPVIPLCHSGMTPSNLPAPLGTLQAATATKENELKLVFPVLAEAIGCTLPQIDYSEFISVVNAFEETSREIKAMSATTPVATTAGFKPHEWATFLEAAEKSTSPGSTIAVSYLQELMGKAGYRAIAVTLAIAVLKRKDLIEVLSEQGWNNESYDVVRLSDEGWRLLEDNQDKLTLVNAPAPQSQPARAQVGSDGDIPF